MSNNNQETVVVITGAKQCLIIQPVVSFSGQSDEVFNARQAGANVVDCFEIIAMCANHAGAAMIDQVKKVVCGQEKVQWHQHSA